MGGVAEFYNIHIATQKPASQFANQHTFIVVWFIT